MSSSNNDDIVVLRVNKHIWFLTTLSLPEMYLANTCCNTGFTLTLPSCATRSGVCAPGDNVYVVTNYSAADYKFNADRLIILHRTLSHFGNRLIQPFFQSCSFVNFMSRKQ